MSDESIDLAIQQGRIKEIHKVSFRTEQLSEIISALQPIATNNKMPIERMVSFFVVDNIYKCTSTDGIAEACIEGSCIAQGKFSFGLRIEDLQMCIKGGGSIQMDVSEERVLVTRGTSLIQLSVSPTKVIPFRVDDGAFELVNAQKMLKVLQSMSKYISVDMNEFNAIMLSDGYAYVRDRLCYVITQLEIRDTVVFSKTMAKQFNSMFNKNIASSPTGDIAIRYNPVNSLTEVHSGRVHVKFKSFDYRGIDLSKFTAFFNVHGNSMYKDELLSAVRELREIEKCTDAFISLEPSRTRLLPKKDNTKTELIIKSASTKEVQFGEKFHFTTNLSYLEKLLAGMNSSTVAIAKQGNFCILINEERDVMLRYFLSTY